MTLELSESTRAKLVDVLHFALSDLRMLTTAGADQQVQDLIVAIELIPDLLLGGHEHDLEATRGGLHEYGQTYGGMARRLSETLESDSETDGDDPNQQVSRGRNQKSTMIG
ncbi:MAG: hypothetical protein ACRCZF_01400 [Gemmataceae bacterium]